MSTEESAVTGRSGLIQCCTVWGLRFLTISSTITVRERAEMAPEKWIRRAGWNLNRKKKFREAFKVQFSSSSIPKHLITTASAFELPLVHLVCFPQPTKVGIVPVAMRNTLIFAGNSCPALTGQICENLGMQPANAELTQFANVSLLSRSSCFGPPSFLPG